jgi:hypothetical protein
MIALAMASRSLGRMLTSLAMLRALQAPGRSHNGWGFSNRMLDATVALMAAK